MEAEKELTLDTEPATEASLSAPLDVPVPEKKKRVSLPVRPASPIELSKIKFHCSKCGGDVRTEFSISDFLTHQYSVHQLISCIYCDEDFQYGRELMVHLHREHRLNNQKFESDEEFMRRGGGRTTVICVECNSLLELSLDSDLNILTNHECRKPPTCQNCGLVLDNIKPEHHLRLCSRSQMSAKMDICKFCKRKLQNKTEGEPVCTLCERIGLHNLSVKPPTPVKGNLPVHQIPPIPHLSLSSSLRKTTKALPPLLPAFGNSATTNLSSTPLESFTLRNTKTNVAGDRKVMGGNDLEGFGSATPGVCTDLSRMNFSSSITVTPLNSPALDDVLNEKKKVNHSILSQENTDLARPKRSLKRVTNEDFMYEKQQKRRVSTPTVSITPVPTTQGTRINEPNSVLPPNPTDDSMQPYVQLSYGGVTSNGHVDNEGTEEWICSKAEQAEAVEEILDPLLSEPDPKRRIELLIQELVGILLVKQEDCPDTAPTPWNSAPFPILVSQDAFSEDALLNQMIEKSSGDCNYCRQAKLIRVDKRQMLLHLLKIHSWDIRISQPKKEEAVKVENDQVPSTTKKSEFETMELAERPGLDVLYKEKEEIPSVEKHMENSNTTTQLRASSSDDEIPLDGVAEVKKLDEDGNWPSDLEKLKEEDKDVEDLNLIIVTPPHEVTNPSHGRLLEEVEMLPGEFYLEMLGKVFNSDEIIFTFTWPERTPFGKAPCECLICGSYSSSQLSLFPHWTKLHRGMSMRCPMCHGNFLFAAALFSHICLGTSKHFLTGTSGAKAGIGGALAVNGSSEGTVNDGAERGTANDTSALRYQCGFCEDLKLPGFFNYMVHLRRDHLSCELCLQTLSSQRELEHHMKKHKSLNHFCWKCSITYLSKPNFMTHLFWKHGTESLECSICMKKKWPHIYHFCIPPPWFACDVCGLFFTKSRSLLVHKRLHSKEKLRHCSNLNCTRQFISASLLRKHCEAEHGDGVKSLAAILPSEDVKIDGCESEDSQDGIRGMEVEEGPKLKVPEETDANGGGNGMKVMEEEESCPLRIVTPTIPSGEAKVTEDPLGKVETKKRLEHHILDEGKLIANKLKNLATRTENPRRVEVPGSELRLKMSGSVTVPIPALNGSPNLPTESPLETIKKEDSPPETDKDSEQNLVDNVNGLNLSEDEGSDDSSSSLSSSSPSSEDEAEQVTPVTDDTGIDSAKGPILQLEEHEEVRADDSKHTEVKKDPPHKFAVPQPWVQRVPVKILSNELTTEVVNRSDGKNGETFECLLMKGNSDEASEISESVEDTPKYSKVLPESSGTVPLLSSSGMIPPNPSECGVQLKKLPGADLPGATPRLDLSSTATATLFDEKAIFDSPLSPMAHTLDEDDSFCTPVTEVPPASEVNSLPDHISLEKTVDGILYEHNYFSTYIPPTPETGHYIYESQLEYFTPGGRLRAKPLVKRVKVLRPGPKPSKKDTKPPKQVKPGKAFPTPTKPVTKSVEVSKIRKRTHSSSSSSSSSSCSSCGTNCSCSSGSSSSSSSSDSSDSKSNSDSQHSQGQMNPTMKLQQPQSMRVKPFPQKRGRKPTPKDEPPKVKRPSRGRPPKGSKRVKGSKLLPLVSGNGLGTDDPEILKHFENPMDAFILEEDLDTTDSESDEIFHKKQLMESIISVPPHIDAPWTAGNEKFLLMEVKGVNDLEELRPKSTLPMGMGKNSGSLRLGTGGNYPIKPLIVRRNVGNAPAGLNAANEAIGLGNREISGKGSLRINLDMDTQNPSVTMSRVPLTAFTSTHASSLVKGKTRSVMMMTTAKGSSSPSSTFVREISNDTNNSTSPSKPIQSVPVSTELNLPPHPATVVAPPRRARMKVTEVKSNVAMAPVPTEVLQDQPEEKLYCICQGPHDNVSQMIGCDAKDCPYQWFHFECVGIVVAPKGKWFCPDCKEKRRSKVFQMNSNRTDGSPGGMSKSPGIRGGVKSKGYSHNLFIGHTVS